MRKHLFLASIAALSLLSACNANIVGQDDGKLLAAMATPSYSGGVPNTWFLYDDSLRTNAWLKGLDFYPGGSFAGTPTIDLSSTISPADGTFCMHFGIGPQTTGWWCGMILLQGANFTDSNAKPAVDIRSGNFTKCVFSARALQGNRTLTFQTLDATNNLTVTITSSWQTYTIPFTNTSDLAHVKQFFSPALGDGIGTVAPIDVFIDDLRYEK
jgi:hypothetical protein